MKIQRITLPWAAIKIPFVSFFLAFTVLSCTDYKQSYTQELLKLKAQAKEELASQVKTFNNYKNRPASDGPYNASNNQQFLENNIPLFKSSNKEIEKVYNYRWWMISKHLKQYHDPQDDKDYWVVTEFFGPRPWASLSGAITCPAGHQFYDVRWLRDPKYLYSYADYFMRGSASYLPQRENANFLTHLSRPESVHFSSWMINGVDALLKIHPDKEWMHTMLPYMEKHQQIWDDLFMIKNENAKTNHMYKILDLYDGMEFSLSATLGLIASDTGAYSLYTKDNWRNYYLEWGTTGNAAAAKQAKEYPDAFGRGYPDLYLARPSINSYMYGNLHALAEMYQQDEADFTADKNLKKEIEYTQKAKVLQQKVMNVLWDNQDQFFYTLTAGDNVYGIKDYKSRVRESVGYTPWYFNMVPHDKKYDEAWQFFASDKGFNNTMGMTTAERQHPYYNEHAYAWNGRGWPFENSVVYKAYANYLRNYKKEVTNTDKALLYQYIIKLANMHGKNELNIGEWYIPSDGTAFGGEKDYFHSTFPDIIIADLLGFKPSFENNFSLQPLLPENEWDYFYLGQLRYHNHDIDIIWKKDWDNKKEGNQSKLCIWVDGKLTATSDHLNEKITVNL
ncbi:MGH1-like glycoside hydrolase domain-containing protein [Zhouia sp. PK063]|uniref:MGH1-like glycoside hydrolase domain-containing protein n=1 Tax=Zhouia sp. PK063 TaxID=3373602 RepID=UPI0037970C70